MNEQINSFAIAQGQFVAGRWQLPEVPMETDGFCAFDATTFEPMPPVFYQASDKDLQLACHEAASAAHWYAQQPPALRAKLLCRIADELAACPHLLPRLQRETGLAIPRLAGELTRTTDQLRAFATHLLTPSKVRNNVEPHGAANHTVALSAIDWPLGPVAVFAASNFPLAFSVAGGDTAAALAAGCPVIVKAHPAHPGGSALTMQAIARALRHLQFPTGIFQLLQSADKEFSHALVSEPAIAAVSFTGSKTAGLALATTCQQRAKPIPFYGELGAVNPQLVFDTLTSDQQTQLAKTALQAITGSGGQLCTKPGLWLIPAGASGDPLVHELMSGINAQPAHTLLGPSFLARYRQLCDQRTTQCQVIARGAASDLKATAQIWSCDASTALATADDWWQQEIFGPCAQIIRYHNDAELQQVLQRLEGQLALSIHGEPTALPVFMPLLASRCGRLLLNQLPTGVLVHPSMMHGGPFPAATNAQYSAVGVTALQRFVRPLCIQAADHQLATGLAVRLRPVATQGE